MEWLNNILSQIQALPPARRLVLAGTAAGSLAFFAWLALGLNQDEYRLLYGGVAHDEAAKVVEVLKAQKVPYRLEAGGSSIYVPASLVYETRLHVAGKGLPGGSSPGLEIFERSGFGVSDFVNRVNYQRALQGELARSIEQLASVERARVQVAIPERRGFVASRSRKPSASVVVALRPGSDLDTQQVHGIVHLVAASVQGLAAKDVTLVDSGGRMLAPDGGGDFGPAVSGGSIAHQERIERELAERIESILGRTVGAGGVVARVRAELDWTQNERTEERFDPDSQVARSEQRSTETAADGAAAAGAAGVPGIASNAPAASASADSGGDSSTARSESRTTETVNYEISKVVSRTVSPLGTLKRLDVAVLVDANAGPEGEAGWTPEAVVQFEELAKRAIGFDGERGDQIAVRTAPFRTIEVGEEPGGAVLSPEIVLLASSVLRFAGVLVALLLFARLVVKPLSARLETTPSAPLPARAAELEMQLGGGAAPGMALGNAASGAAPALPAPLAGDENLRTLRAWLKER